MQRAVLDVQKSLFFSIELDFGEFRVARSLAECASAHSCEIWFVVSVVNENVETTSSACILTIIPYLIY
jgi:hypothetical protein